MKRMTSLFLSLLAFFTACNNPGNKLEDGLYADIKTTKGNIIVQLEYQKTPITVANFVALAEGKNPFVNEQLKGKPFYDGLKFHRVIPNFMIQGGDPDGNGSGGPGYQFKDEFHTDLKHDKAGILSMANAGPGTNGSQFFITHKETSWLDNKHSVFGHVVEGQDVVNTIVQDDAIEKITIIRKGKDAKRFDAVKIFKEYHEKEAEENKKLAEKIKKSKIESIARIEQLKVEGTKTKSGVIYKFINKGEGKKPTNGTEVYVHYAGFLETTGELFDTSFEDIADAFGKLDPNRAKANGYKPFPFKYGNKQGLIPGFIEGLEQMNYGDRILVYIPSALGYGKQGAGNVIPPNSNIVFEIEMLETMPK
jgi:cyclophilin family peptidyl-prolyl cis-trans isomerase